MTDPFVHVLDEDALPVGTMKTVKVDGTSILLANVEGEMLAIGAICTHASQDLARGDLDDDTVVCPLHFSSFSLRTGEALDGPARRPEPVFRVKRLNGQVLVDPTPLRAEEL